MSRAEETYWHSLDESKHRLRAHGAFLRLVSESMTWLFSMQVLKTDASDSLAGSIVKEKSLRYFIRTGFGFLTGDCS